MALSSTRRGVVAGLAMGMALLIGKTGALSATKKKTVRLRKWMCTDQDCDPYVYDPSVGDPNVIDEENPIPPGVAFEDLPDDWICPLCGDLKSDFVPMNKWVTVEVDA